MVIPVHPPGGGSMSGRTPPFVSTRVGRYFGRPIREVFSHEPLAPRRRRHALLRQLPPLDRSSGDRAAHLGGSGPGAHAGTPGHDGWPPAGRQPQLCTTAAALPGARRPRRGGAAGPANQAGTDSGVRRSTRRGGRPTRPRRHPRHRSRQGGGQVDPTPGTYLAATPLPPPPRRDRRPRPRAAISLCAPLESTSGRPADLGASSLP